MNPIRRVSRPLPYPSYNYSLEILGMGGDGNEKGWACMHPQRSK